MDIATVRDIEGRALSAWPALRTVLIGGWVVRLSAGCTKRANSLNALDPSLPLETVRGEAEALYAASGLPPIVRLTPLAPPFADMALAGEGYRRADPSIVMSAPLDVTPRPPTGVDISSSASADWLDGAAQANGIPIALKPAHDAIVRAIGGVAAFATARANGNPVGYGLAVCERGMVGLFDIVVAPDHRGRGHGRAVTQALLSWGRRAGASSAYLQVREENRVALDLYARMRFTERYRYHYRVR